jgi:two-component system OmpR family response regulator
MTQTMVAASTARQLLVVDDEPTLAELLSATLRFAGFAVTVASTGAEALEAAERKSPDLILLDVMLPDMDGFDVLRRLRERTRTAGSGRQENVPVLFLTARGGAEDKIKGLMLGGDDYVTKPFNLEELIARIHAILRRTGDVANGRLVVANLELDPAGHEVRRAGRVVHLSPTEFKLLHYLLLNTGQVVSKSQILEQVWDYDFDGDASIVDSYISYLRRKVDVGEPKLIHTVNRVGFVLRAPRR